MVDERRQGAEAVVQGRNAETDPGLVCIHTINPFLLEKENKHTTKAIERPAVGNRPD